MNTVKCSNRLCEKEYSIEFDKCPFCGTPNPMEESERISLIENNKTPKDWSDNSNSNPFNVVVVSLIWISIIFFGIRGITSSIANMIFEPAIGCLTLCITLIGLVSLFFILQAKKWALFLWMGYRLSAGIVNGFISSKYDLATNIIIAIANIGLMVLVLQIKKNGVSAWSVIFNKQKPSVKRRKALHKNKKRKDIDNSEPSISKIKTSNESTDSFKVDETQCALKEDVLSTPISTPATNEVQEKKITAIIPNEQPIERNVQNQSNETMGKSRKQSCKKKTLRYKKWWLYLIIIVGILAIALLAVWLSLRFSKLALGDYVYVDDYNILHVDRNCENIANIHGAKPITMYSLHEIESGKWKQVCSNCVSDDIYEKISSYVIVNDNLRVLYNTLLEDNYDMPNHEQFLIDIQDTNKRHELHTNMIKDGYMLPEYNDFVANFEVGTKRPPLRIVNYEKNNKRLLYDELINEYDLGSYEQFSRDVENIDKRKKLYYEIKQKYMIPSFDYFTRYLINNEK